MSTTLPPAQTDDQLRAQASKLVGTEVQSAIDPLQAQVGTLQTQSDRAVGQIGSEFNQLQPVVQGGVQQVQTSYDNAAAAQAQIFQQAQARLSQMKQDRAAEAQRMAQEMGGPVAVGEFTAGFDPALQSLTELGAGAQLHNLAYGQAGVQQASQFASQVFPVLQTEQQANARAYYGDQIKTIQKQITELNAQRPTLVNARFLELQKNNLDYKLQAAQLNLQKINDQKQLALQTKQFQLDALKVSHDWKTQLQQINLEKTKAQRDWEAAKQTLSLEGRKVKLAEKGFDIQTAGLTGTYKGAPTLQARELTLAEKRQAHALNMDMLDYQLAVKKLAISTKYANKKISADHKAEWAAYLDAAVNPQPGKTVTHTISVPVPAAAAITGKVTDAYKDPASPTGYSRLEQQVETPVTEPILEPNALVDYLVAHGEPKKLAIQAVRARLSLPNWDYGQKLAAPKVKPKPKPKATNVPSDLFGENPYKAKPPYK